ncbi:hypothetical protein [Galbibacter sp.]|uniref:hypothetical protein n=1 Tax=Galbibacter sp. TaxID=2918471 RepID=UPI003A9217EB
MSSSKFLVTLTRVLAYFSLFYAILKGIAIFGKHFFWPNLILGLLGAIVAFLLFRVIKNESYNWIYVIICVLLFSAIRYYEERLMVYLDNFFV